MKATASINLQAVCFMRPVLLAKDFSARATHLISMKELGILLGLPGGRLDPLKPFENPISTGILPESNAHSIIALFVNDGLSNNVFRCHPVVALGPSSFLQALRLCFWIRRTLMLDDGCLLSAV